jgi:hypothetical protein
MKNDVIDKFASLEADVAKKRGDFVLFALFAREDVTDRWDLIVSAPWAKNSEEGVKLLVGEIKSRLGSKELQNLSRIVVVGPKDPPVQALNKFVRVEHGKVELREVNLFGTRIDRAYIITSKPPDSSAAA